MNGPLTLVTSVGRASGSRAAAAALACAGSDPDRAGLLIDVGGRPPRPTLLAAPGARQLEERLAAHLPDAPAAARGQTCHLAVEADPVDFDAVRAALPLVRDSVAVAHLAPGLLRAFLGEEGIESSSVLLRADLTADRALTALAARDLIGHGLTVKVLKRPLAWVPARRALFGVLPSGAPGGLGRAEADSLLESAISAAHQCYSGRDDAETEPAGTAEQERRGDAGAGRGRGLHRHPQREAGR